ncbi:hypothetical protein HRbin19_01092 [bacterium HR19]|nr:hypothetical protein HRbin19_01092 [bacterium HR19]
MMRIRRQREQRKEEESKKSGEREIYDELKNLLLRLPALWNILTTLTEKGTNISKTIGQTISSVLREELRAFLRSVDLVGLMKRVILDTAVELKIEITFKDKSSDKTADK